MNVTIKISIPCNIFLMVVFKFNIGSSIFLGFSDIILGDGFILWNIIDDVGSINNSRSITWIGNKRVGKLNIGTNKLSKAKGIWIAITYEIAVWIFLYILLPFSIAFTIVLKLSSNKIIKRTFKYMSHL